MIGSFATLLAPAKINLFLELYGKRADGYHELVTVMMPIQLFDRVSLRASDNGSVSVRVFQPRRRQLPHQEEIPCDHSNLTAKALLLFLEHTGTNKNSERGAEITIVKGIPSQAGLGGGSSNAAATLLLANQLWGTKLPLGQLEQLAARIGSDVPFFLHRSVAVCSGRGEQVLPIRCSQMPWMVIAKPPVGNPTTEVYQHVQFDRKQSPRTLDNLLKIFVVIRLILWQIDFSTDWSLQRRRLTTGPGDWIKRSGPPIV